MREMTHMLATQEALSNNNDTIVRFGVRRGDATSLISVVVVRTPLTTGTAAALSTSTSSFSASIPGKPASGLSMSMSGLESVSDAANAANANAANAGAGPTMGGSYSGTSFATPGGTYSGYNGSGTCLFVCLSVCVYVSSPVT
jgi:hypothetical protein